MNGAGAAEATETRGAAVRELGAVKLEKRAANILIYWQAAQRC